MTTVNYNALARMLLGQNTLVRPASASVPNALYTIHKGDTLGAIARMFGVSVADLAKWNRIKNPNKIREGATLLTRPVPLSPPPPAKAGGPIIDQFVGRGEQPYPYSPNPVSIDLPKGDPLPLGLLGANPGAAGMQTIMTQMPGSLPTFNPTTQREGPAAALTKKKEWTPGDEGALRPREISIPVEVLSEPSQHLPPPAKPKTTFDRYMADSGYGTLASINSYLDPTKVLSGHAGEIDYSPSLKDILGVALMGTGAKGGPSPKTEPVFTGSRLPADVTRNARGQFVKVEGFRPQPKLSPARRPPVSVDPKTGRFVRGVWPEGKNPNLAEPFGFRPEPRFGKP